MKRIEAQTTSRIVKCECGRNVLEGKSPTGIDRWIWEIKRKPRPLHRCRFWKKERKDDK